MKRILFFLSLAVLFAGCGKDKINFKESDLVGTWAHLKSVNAYGDVSENLQVTEVLKANHECTTYYSMTSDAGTWELNGREINIGGAKSTIVSLDGRYLTTKVVEKEGTYTDTYVKVESLMVGTWTVTWTLGGNAQYATFNAGGTSSWQNAKNGESMGTPNWTVGVNEYWSRPTVVYSGSNWDEYDTILAVEQDGDQLRVIDFNGISGIYARGHLTIQ